MFGASFSSATDLEIWISQQAKKEKKIEHNSRTYEQYPRRADSIMKCWTGWLLFIHTRAPHFSEIGFVMFALNWNYQEFNSNSWLHISFLFLALNGFTPPPSPPHPLFTNLTSGFLNATWRNPIPAGTLSFVFIFQYCFWSPVRRTTGTANVFIWFGLSLYNFVSLFCGQCASELIRNNVGGKRPACQLNGNMSEFQASEVIWNL